MALCWRHLDPKPPGPWLHFAPEPGISRMISTMDRRIFTTDLERGAVDFQSDIEQIPLSDESIGCIVCSDVLEHVIDDSRAMSEMCRVLAKDGVGLVHVPMLSESTVEFGFALRVAHNHRRMYGPDISERFSRAGLAAGVFAGGDISSKERRRYGVGEGDVIFLVRPGVSA